MAVSAPGSAASVKVAGGSVDLPSYQLVDLDGPAPEIVLHGLTNPLSGGETVQLILTFATAGSVSLTVPVEPHAYDFATYLPAAHPDADGHRPAQGDRVSIAGLVRDGFG